jgi:hypothetical protein
VTQPSPTTPINLIAHCNTAIITTTKSQPQPNHTGHRLIADSGATHFMTGIPSLFEEITYYKSTNVKDQPQVLLGDDSTYHPVEGYGWVNYLLARKRIWHQALFIPTLGATSLLSVRQHMQWKGNYFHVEANTASLAFGQAIVDFDVNDEIKTFIIPASISTLPYTFDKVSAIPYSPTSSNHH